jgi:hypothetical protein
MGKSTRLITAADWQQIAKTLPSPPAGAFTPGTRIEKIKTERGDSQPVGARGTVIVALPEAQPFGAGYVIEWDALPGMAVLVMAFKVGPIPTVH